MEAIGANFYEIMPAPSSRIMPSVMVRLVLQRKKGGGELSLKNGFDFFRGFGGFHFLNLWGQFHLRQGLENP